MYVSDLSARHANVLLFMPSLSCCCRSLQLHIVYLRLLFAVICVVCRSFRSFAYCFATRYTLAQTNTHTHAYAYTFQLYVVACAGYAPEIMHS